MTRTDDVTKEILERVRRVETRLTGFMIAQGYAIGTDKTRVEMRGDGHCYIDIPSPSCQLKDILNAVPKGVLSFSIRIGGEVIARVER